MKGRHNYNLQNKKTKLIVEKYTFDRSYIIKVHKLQFIHFWKQRATGSWLLSWEKMYDDICTILLISDLTAILATLGEEIWTLNKIQMTFVP